MEIEQTGTLFVRAKESVDVIQDFTEMLYHESDGLALSIDQLVQEKVAMAMDMQDSIAGFENAADEADKHQFVVRLNKLENSLYDFNDKVQTLFEGVEDNYCGIDKELVPALQDLNVQFEANELEPFVRPFIAHEYLYATSQSSKTSEYSAKLISVQSLSKLTDASVVQEIVQSSLSLLISKEPVFARFETI